MEVRLLVFLVQRSTNKENLHFKRFSSAWYYTGILDFEHKGINSWAFQGPQRGWEYFAGGSNINCGRLRTTVDCLCKWPHFSSLHIYIYISTWLCSSLHHQKMMIWVALWFTLISRIMWTWPWANSTPKPQQPWLLPLCPLETCLDDTHKRSGWPGRRNIHSSVTLSQTLARVSEEVENYFFAADCGLWGGA